MHAVLALTNTKPIAPIAIPLGEPLRGVSGPNHKTLRLRTHVHDELIEAGSPGLTHNPFFREMTVAHVEPVHVRFRVHRLQDV